MRGEAVVGKKRGEEPSGTINYSSFSQLSTLSNVI